MTAAWRHAFVVAVLSLVVCCCAAKEPRREFVTAGRFEEASEHAAASLPVRRRHRHWSFFARPGDDPRKVAQHQQKDHEKEVDREALGYSLCLMGAVAFNMSLFYLVNFQREEIRATTWKTLNMTISIFSSVLIYGVIRTTLVDILAPSHYGLVILNLALLGVLYLVMQVALFFLKDSADHLMLLSGGTIFAHITGFAAMFGFAGLMTVPPFEASPLAATAVIGFAAVVIVAFTLIAAVAREVIAKANDGIIDDKEEKWMEQVEETENDVLCLCLGFTLMQVIRFAITGSLHSIEPEESPKGVTQFQTNLLFLCSLMFAGTTFAGTWLVERELKRNKRAGHVTRRYAKALQNVSSMAMAWCLLAWGEWQVYTLGFNGVRISGCMVIALGLTAFCLTMIFVLDIVNDRFMRADGTGSKSLRSLELALGVVIGFAWELAFDIALEEISRGLSFGLGLGVARQVSKHLLPVLLLLVVLPAWHTYILPRSVVKEA